MNVDDDYPPESPRELPIVIQYPRTPYPRDPYIPTRPEKVGLFKRTTEKIKALMKVIFETIANILYLMYKAIFPKKVHHASKQRSPIPSKA